MEELRFLKETEFREFADRNDQELESIRKEIRDESTQRIEQHHTTTRTLDVLSSSVNAMAETQKSINDGLKEMNGNIAKQTEAVIEIKYQTIENTKEIKETQEDLKSLKDEIETRRKDNASIFKWFIGLLIGGSGLTPIIALFLK